MMSRVSPYNSYNNDSYTQCSWCEEWKSLNYPCIIPAHCCSYLSHCHRQFCSYHCRYYRTCYNYFPFNTKFRYKYYYKETFWSHRLNHSLSNEDSLSDIYKFYKSKDKIHLNLRETLSINRQHKKDSYKAKVKPYEYSKNHFPYEVSEDIVNDIHINELKDSPFVDSINYQSNKEISLDKPIGFNNPEGYCYLNSVIQALRGCVDFNKQIIHMSINNEIKNDDKNVLLLRDMSQLFQALNDKTLPLVDTTLDNVQKYFQDNSDGDDIHKFYLQLLTHLHKGIQIVDESLPKFDINQTSNNANDQFKKSEMKNKGFIFKLFYGQMNIKIKCFNCSKTLRNGFTLFKSISLPVPKLEKKVSLKSCIDSFLSQTKIVDYDGIRCDCLNESEEYATETEITHVPLYLMLYINRGSYFENGEKNNVFVSSGESLELTTVDGVMNYKLISVIDHIGNHYFCKCNYESEHWWLLNDTQVTKVEAEGIITKNSIGFIFKKF